MSQEFVSEHIQAAYRDKTPLDVPKVSHPSRAHWVNRGIQQYIEIFGQSDWDKFAPNELPIPMPRGTEERKQLEWRTFKAKLQFGFKALFTGRRATHQRGVAARGTVRVVDKPDIPDHDFYRPGREFPCRLRHANASFYDDACSQVRGCSLKFADSERGGPLDIIMNTGAIQAFYSFDSFMAFVNARTQCREHYWLPQREFMRTLPACFLGTIDSVRVAPDSWADMVYHSCIVFPFTAMDGKKYYIKYRVMREGLERETGLIPPSLQKNPWVQCRMDGESRGRSYLPDEFRSRLASGPLVYILQCQIREWRDDETDEFFNPSRYWDEAKHPWKDLAVVTLKEALPDKEMERMRMWLGNHPDSLGVTDADSAQDYRSLAWVRKNLYGTSQWARQWLRGLGLQRRMRVDF